MLDCGGCDVCRSLVGTRLKGSMMGKEPPAMLSEWMDLLARLVHVQIGSPKEPHDISVMPVGDSKINGPAKAYTVYGSASACVGVDALVTGVSYEPPSLPVKVGNEWKHEMDVLFPHGRLRLTVDLFLKAPLVDCGEVENERIDDE